MKFQIKNRYNDSILFEVEADSFVKALENAIRQRANLSGADLSWAGLSETDLSWADLSDTNLSRANLFRADLSWANLFRADLSWADLSETNLFRADLSGADLSETNLFRANLFRANLSGANLSGAKNTVKIMGVEPGNFYWKRFEKGLKNNDYQFYVGLNTLREGEVFASDDRVVCSHPGFHFASRSWCAVNYPDRPLEAHIRIPEDAQINEPWTTDGKASADKIEIIQVFDVKTGKDVTDKYRRQL